MLRYIFRKTEPALIRLYHRLAEPPSPNLRGDREIEYSWVLANLPQGPGQALDFGCGQGSYLGLVAARRGFQVTAIDLEPVKWNYLHKNLEFVQGDVLKLPFSPQQFDLVVNCSTVEHVGLAGRFGVKEPQLDGDLTAMSRLRSLMKLNATQLLTIPVGKDAVFPPLHRVYGEKRLPKLLESYVVKKKEYWIKNDQNQWMLAEESAALKQVPNQNLYGLGCFVLRL